MWDLSCVDWEERIRSGQSLIPNLPLFQREADLAVKFFDALRLPDVPGMPLLRDAAGPWFRDIIRAVFGSRDPETNERLIREVMALVPKGQSKTTYSGGLMITAMLMNLRPRAEMLFVGPTQAISDRAYNQAVGMIEADPELLKRFDCVLHLKEIRDRLNQSSMKVKTFDLNILTGAMPVVVLLDELHLLGRNPHAAKVIRQIRGGLEKNSEGFFLIITTQSDEPPAGAFRDELITARKIRDGKFAGKVVRSMLPVLYEFPEDIGRDPIKWQDPANWHMVMPNLGRSMRLDSLTRDWETERVKGMKDIAIWASQHLNIEIGVGQKTDGWPGAEFWESSEDPDLTLDVILDRSEAIVVGADGGGLDDLFGANVLGREIGTRTWLSWSHAWCHKGVLSRRQTIAARLEDFENAGDIEIIDDEFEDVSQDVDLLKQVEEMLLPKDVAGFLRLINRINQAGLLAAVAVDVEGPYGELIDALALIGVTQESGQIVGVGQGYRLMNALKTSERKLANGTLKHCPSVMMDWCVANIKIEPTATAIRATKQNAGDAKIDPAMALFDAVSVMLTNPEAKGVSVFDLMTRHASTVEEAQSTDIDPAILADPLHARFSEMRDRYNHQLAMADEDVY
ncbi:terminase large subunit [Mesorhizobium sp.]|uniref:terminase large subunit n=1 Tax=Mesorhizobium sp. TaxID=1871066 RepID=UPI000FE950BA|nr:terminase large subunit [Mesorhizobium sp.]RWF66857.1 MAG: terminase large subunit [Mesorhizobium sp.]